VIPDDPRKLIGGHITGSLDKSESDRLMARAVEDQALFDELLDVEPLRGVLAEEDFREQLVADLRARLALQPIPLWERLRRMLFRPMVIPALGLIAATVVVLMIRQGVLREDSGIAQVALGPAGVPLLRAAGILDVREGEPERLRQVQAEPAPETASGSIAFDRGGNQPEYRVGDPIRIGFRIAENASVMVIEERSDGSAVRLYPNRYQSSAEVTAGETVWIPPGGQGPLEVDGPPGKRLIRVLVFPANVDPLDFTRPWNSIRQQATAFEKTYEVRN
jgi:hypothetical protein